MTAAEDRQGRRVATVAEALYLANLLIAPGLAFVLLLLWWRLHAPSASPLGRNHLRQAMAGSLLAGAMLLGVSAAVVALGGMGRPATWVVLVLYFVSCHAALVLFGVLGLSRAMNGKTWRFPLIGPR